MRSATAYEANRVGATPMRMPPRPALPTDKVRFVGDPVAFVVAEAPLQAKDAAEAVEIDIDPLPAVTTPKAAAAPDAPLLHEEAPGNIALDYHYGDADAVAAAFAKAAHITRVKLIKRAGYGRAKLPLLRARILGPN